MYTNVKNQFRLLKETSAKRLTSTQVVVSELQKSNQHLQNLNDSKDSENLLLIKQQLDSLEAQIQNN